MVLALAMTLIGVAGLIFAVREDRGWFALFFGAMLMVGTTGIAIAIDSSDFVVRYQSFKATIEVRTERATELERAALYREIADTNAKLASQQYWYDRVTCVFADTRIPTLEPIRRTHGDHSPSLTQHRSKVMPDEITATGGESKFKPHPEGQFVAQCVDVINLGQKVDQYPGKPARLVPKVAIIFRTGERRDDGQPFDIGAEFTISTGEKASLRGFLEAWRGKSYDEETLKAGIPLHKLCGNHALVSIEHKKSNSGRVYGKIRTVAPVPQGLPRTDLTYGYTRAEYWQTRKDEYAKEAQEFAAKVAAANHDGDAPQAPDDDGLPF